MRARSGARRSRSRVYYKSAKKRKEKKKKTVILYYPDLFYTWTNKHYRRVSSGGNECARSSRRGAGLTSSSLGGGLDPDGPQGHAVVTQKRKLRTPVWARLRNIHISDPRYDSTFVFPHVFLPPPLPPPPPPPSLPALIHTPVLISPSSSPIRPFCIRAVDALCRFLLSNDRLSRVACLERRDYILSRGRSLVTSGGER